MNDLSTRQTHEENFLAILVLLAVGGLFWIFLPFLPGLLLATLFATATYRIMVRLQRRFRLTLTMASLAMTILVALLVITPLVYLVSATGLRMADELKIFQTWLASFHTTAELVTVLHAKMANLPLPDQARDLVVSQVIDHRQQLGSQSAGVAWLLVKGVTNSGLTFISSLGLILFAMFFFYRDGPKLVRRLKVLSPLSNRYDEIIIHRFGALATVLTLSTSGIALLQGSLFALVTAFMDLPWFYLGVAIAVASFIPVVGGMIVWGPVSYYIYHTGHPAAGLFLALWGAVVLGFAVDNLLRPLLIGWLAQQESSSDTGGELDIMSHTLLTTLATLGGVLGFGILGLFFGPLSAAMAITIFDVYELKHGEWLDRS